MECQDDVYRNGHFQFSNGLARLDYGVASGGRMRPNLVQRMDCNAGKKQGAESYGGAYKGPARGCITGNTPYHLRYPSQPSQVIFRYEEWYTYFNISHSESQLSTSVRRGTYDTFFGKCLVHRHDLKHIFVLNLNLYSFFLYDEFQAFYPKIGLFT